MSGTSAGNGSGGSGAGGAGGGSSGGGGGGGSGGEAPTISQAFMFGINQQVRDNIHFVADHLAVYPVGCNIVVHNMETNSQRFIAASHSDSTEISAVCVSPNNKYIAIAVNGTKPSVTVYDSRTLRQRRVLTAASLAADETKQQAIPPVAFVRFSPNSQCLVSLSVGNGALDIKLWEWEDMRVVAEAVYEFKAADRKNAGHVNKLHVQCSFCPQDPQVIFITGKRFLSCIRLAEDKQFEVLPMNLKGRKRENYMCHTWVHASAVALSTEKGDIHLYDTNNFLAELDESPARSRESPGQHVTCFAAHENNFILAGCKDGQLRIFQLGEDLDQVRSWVMPTRIRDETLIFERGTAVWSINMSPSGEHVVFSTGDGQLWKGTCDWQDLNEKSELELEPLVSSFHSGAITGLDVCVRKPLLVTCGQDNTVRVWNYMTHKLELKKSFSERPVSVAIHPTGLHLVVGFNDKLRLMNVLMDDIRTFREYPFKNSNEVQFSHGGHAFAAVTGKSVVVYAFFSGEKLMDMRVHGVIKSISWTADDSSIVTAGLDGSVYEQKLLEKTKSTEWVQKQCKYTGAVATSNEKIFAVGDDGFIKEISGGDVTKKLQSGSPITQMALSSTPYRMLFVSSSTGLVRSYRFPITGESVAYHVASSAITRMRVTTDDAHLIVTSESGFVAIYDIKEALGRFTRRDVVNRIAFSAEVLVTRSDLEEKQASINDLKTSVDELTVHNAYQVRLHDINHQDQLKETTEKFNLQLEHYKSKHEMLQDEKQDLEVEYEERMKAMEEKHTQKVHQLDLDHQHMIMEQVKRFHELEMLLETDTAQQQHSMQVAKKQHEQRIFDARRAFAERRAAVNAECEAVRTSKEVVKRKFDETVHQLEQDTDKEVMEIKSKYEKKLHLERETTLRLQGENGIMRKKFGALKKDIEDQQEEIKIMLDKESELYQKINQLEREIRGHKRQIDKRDVTIGEKETEIYDLKKQNQELEKSKFVLDFQIKDLKRHIEPRENEIILMKQQIMELDASLESFHRENGALEEQSAELEARIVALQGQTRRKRQQQRDLELQIERFQMDLEVVVQHIQDPPVLANAVEDLYEAYVPEPITQAEVDPEVEKEFLRQEGYLNHEVEQLKREMTQQGRQRTVENMRIMQENVALIKEINDLRKEIRNLRHSQGKWKGSSSSSPAASTNRQRAREQQRGNSGMDEQEALKIIQVQHQTIENLRAEIEKAELMSVGGVSKRPTSRERLPPLSK